MIHAELFALQYYLNPGSLNCEALKVSKGGASMAAIYC